MDFRNYAYFINWQAVMMRICVQSFQLKNINETVYLILIFKFILMLNV